MGKAKNQSRSQTKKRAGRAPQASAQSKLRASASTSARGRARAKAAPVKASNGAKSRTAGAAKKKAAPKGATKGRAVAKSKSTNAAAKPKAVKRASSAGAKVKSSLQKKSSLPKNIEAKPAAKAPIKRRRDATGHLDPQYARDLRALSNENRDGREDRAFFNQPRTGDDLAEELGEEAVETMTSGEDQSDHLIAAEVEEERGGPFVKTRASDEFARGTDRSNPRDATREPFPRT
jgi:hypothetical protein